MSWVGLRDINGGVFRPAGLGRQNAADCHLDGLMPSGTLMMEFASNPRGGVQTLLNYGSSHPWAAGLRVTLGEDGLVTLLHWQGDQRRKYTLRTDLVAVTPSVTLTYTWDAPLRRGVLSVKVSEGSLYFAELVAPLPMSLRDGQRMMSDLHHCAMHSGVCFAALSDEVMPIGVLPTLDGNTLIKTPHGLVPICKLRAGQRVVTAAGDVAQIRWCGSTLLPARGRFAPLVMRAPYHGLQRDIIVAADQRLRMAGSEIEYLFGTENVAMRAGHLADDVSVTRIQSGPTHRYWQLLLDRAAPMSVAGMTIEGLDITGVQIDPSLRKHSAVAALPPELVPPAAPSQVPLLRSYETRTWRTLAVG